jgi:hypothetical protein
MSTETGVARNDGDVSYMLYVGHFRVFGWRGGGL